MLCERKSLMFPGAISGHFTRVKFYFYFIFSLCPLDANPLVKKQTKFYVVSLNCSIKLNCFVSILCSI